MFGASERVANGSHLHSSVHLVDDVDVRSYEPNSVVFNGVSAIPRSQFSALALSDAIEWDYIRAIERISSKDFQFLSIGLGDAKQLAAVAAFFRLDYRVDDSLGAWAKSITNWLAKLNPGLVTFPALIMGNPFLDECPIGIPANTPPSVRLEYFSAFLDGMSELAADDGIKILALKDIACRDAAWAHDLLSSRGFSRMPSLPVAELTIRWDSADEYIASLRPKMRSDLRRKLRQSKAVRTEVRDTIAGLEDQIIDLYRQTQARRKMDCPGFDEIPVDLFREVTQGLRGRGRVLLCWLDQELVCFNLFLESKDKIVGKYLGMNYAHVRAYNLYFVNWMRMLEYAIASGVKTLQVGQTSYDIKVKLGCELHPSWVYFKHTGKVRGPLFRWFAPWASYAQFDPDLGRLVDRSPK